LTTEPDLGTTTTDTLNEGVSPNTDTTNHFGMHTRINTICAEQHITTAPMLIGVGWFKPNDRFCVCLSDYGETISSVDGTLRTLGFTAFFSAWMLCHGPTTL
jgi:hypothetical protein